MRNGRRREEDGDKRIIFISPDRCLVIQEPAAESRQLIHMVNLRQLLTRGQSGESSDSK